MSKPYKQRFKGVENFLRRVAYNLGNTPSQTEVKIISCIPIDVTDLQAKIQFLERQLHETNKNHAKTPPPENSPEPNSAAPQSPPVTPTPELIKSNTGGDKGNAVGDKNRKVGDKDGSVNNKDNVVRDKDGAVGNKGGAVGDKASKPNSGTVVNTVLYGGSQTLGYSSNKSLRSDRSRNKTNSGSSSRHRKSNVSFALPVIMTTSKDEHPHCSYSSRKDIDPDNAIKNISEAERKLAAAEHYYNNLFKIAKRKRKVCRGKSKTKTQLVYFAQNTQNNPFNNDLLDPFETLNNNRTCISHAYLDNVIRKQYDPKFVVQEFSDTSHFSRPVCRNTGEKLARSRLYESDVCSCCHGLFQNIDDYMPKGFDSINNIMQYEPNYINTTYYDSNLYDVVPVKEKTNKFLKESNLPKRDIEIRCWPEQFRSKNRDYSKTVKYQAESPLKRHHNLTFQKIKHKSEQYNVEQKRINNQVYETSKVTLKRCYNDSKINKNNTYLSDKVKKSEPVKTIVLRNKLIETDNNNINTKLLLKNQSTQLELIEDNKTETTLNQIKSILQSVLAEVKTNPKVNRSMEKTSKRDAVVQKGSSQNNMQGQSTLLHSYTYNHSYNAHPYMPSYSRQLSAGQYCLDDVPYQPSLKYLQNFPVFVHPSSGRRLCACYHKRSSHKSSKYKQASAAATNTDKEIAEQTEISAGNKETEKLIKEIYKSMAVNLDFPTKENSVSEYDDLKSTGNLKSNVKDVRSSGMKAVDKRDVEVEALITSNESNDSSTVSNTTINQPKDKPRTYEVRRNNNSTESKTNHDEILHRFQQRSTETIIEDDEDTDISSDDTEDENVIDIKEFEIPPKHERKGLLQRMFHSVKMFKKRKADRKIHNESEEASEASDSDDYETIYSGRTAVLQPKDRRQSYNYKTSSKGKSADQNAFIRPLHEKSRRSPYLEQEFRRQWNERLMFDKPQERKYSSERPLSEQPPLKDARPVYWNDYEARSAIVDNNLQSPLHYVDSKAKVSQKLKRISLHEINDSAVNDKLRWLKKHNLAKCGEQWKKFVLEN